MVMKGEQDARVLCCYRAAILKEKVHDVVFRSEAGHRISFNAAHASVDGCCSFVFTVADG